jgi:hypothetical protein
MTTEPSDDEIKKYWNSIYPKEMDDDKAAIRLYRLAYEAGKKAGIEEGCTCEVDNEPPDKEGYND